MTMCPRYQPAFADSVQRGIALLRRRHEAGEILLPGEGYRFLELLEFYRFSAGSILRKVSFKRDPHRSQPSIFSLASHVLLDSDHEDPLAAYVHHVKAAYQDERICIQGVLHMLLFAAFAVLLRMAAGGKVDAGMLLRISRIDTEHCIGCVLDFEAALQEDPSGIYAHMDARTKNDYRVVISVLSSRSARPPIEPARTAVAMAKSYESSAPGAIESHVGFYLTAPGRDRLWSALGIRGGPPGASLSTDCRIRLLIGAELILAGLLTMLVYAAMFSFADVANAEIWLPCCAFVAAESAMLLGKRLTAALLPARRLPSMTGAWLAHALDRTVICIPTMISDRQGLHEVVANALTNYQNARHAGIRVVMLVDFPDAADKDPTAEQIRLLEEMRQKFRDLNSCRDGATRRTFLLAWRERRYSSTQRAWIGYERKRGKVQAFFDHIVNGDSQLMFSDNDESDLSGVDYALVIDDDSVAAPGALHALVATLSHPLNHAVDTSDAGTGHGYAVIVPSVSERQGQGSLLSHSESPLFNLTGTCNFAGKGLYDVRICQRALLHRFPEDRILAHDTYEGFWLRSGFCADAIVIESMPASYVSVCERRHRWMRGDIQNMVYVMKRLSSLSIGAVSWYVLYGQLVNIVSPIALTGLVIAVIAQANRPGAALAIFVAIGTLPAIVTLGRDVVRLARSPGHWRILSRRAAVRVLFIGIDWISAPHRALVYLDATLRTLLRLMTRKKLLEWRTSRWVETGRRGMSLPRALTWVPAVVAVIALALHAYPPGHSWVPRAVLLSLVVSPVVLNKWL